MPAPWSRTTAGRSAANGRPPVAAKTVLPLTRNCTGLAGLLRNSQGLFQIVDDISRRLQADGEPHQIFADARGLEGYGIHLGMGRAGGVNDQGLGVAHIGQMGGKAERFDEFAPRLAAALDAESDDRAGTL